MKTYDCISCGVAFDVGAMKCNNPSCVMPMSVGTRSVKSLVRIGTPKRQIVDPIYSRYASVRYRAAKKQIPFELTQDLIQHILNQACVYCGDTEGIQLDRKAGEAGYTPDNVVPACKRCNTVKSMYLTHDEMIIVAKALGWRR